MICPFCNIEQSRILKENEHCFVIYDGFPVTKLHSLIIPKRHVRSLFDLTQEELKSAYELLSWAKSFLEGQDEQVAAFNVGINDGPEAGQTIPHCHFHLIPRRHGDMDDPRGGVRGVIPNKQKY